MDTNGIDAESSCSPFRDNFDLGLVKPTRVRTWALQPFLLQCQASVTLRSVVEHKS